MLSIPLLRLSRTSLIIVSVRERIIKSGLLLFRATSPGIATARTHRAARGQNEIFPSKMLPVCPTAADTCRLADYKGINGKQLDFSGRATPHSRGRSSRAHSEIRLPHEGAAQADDTADFAAAHYPATFPVTSVCRQFLRIIVSARLYYNFGRKRERGYISSIKKKKTNFTSLIYFLLKFTNFEINHESSKSITSIFITDIGIEWSLYSLSLFVLNAICPMQNYINCIKLCCSWSPMLRNTNCHTIHIKIAGEGYSYTPPSPHYRNNWFEALRPCNIRYRARRCSIYPCAKREIAVSISISSSLSRGQ